MNDKWQWWSGLNDEFYTNGPFDTREEAIEALYGCGGYIIEAVAQQIGFSVERLLEDQYYETEDWFDYDNVEPGRRGDHVRADAELQSLLNDWLERHRDTFVQPSMFMKSRNEAWIAADAESE